MATPAPDSLRLAAFWLRSNEGDERAVLLPVAQWLDTIADRNEIAAAKREAIHEKARELGVKPAAIRAALRGKRTRGSTL